MSRSGDDSGGFSQTCPRCGDEFNDDDPARVVDLVVGHALEAHQHRLERRVVLAHLYGVRPDELDD